MIEFAFAKLTLSLRVTAVRSDGYHELDAVAVCVDRPCDELRIDIARHGVRVVPAGSAPIGAENLVSKAMEALGVEAQIELHKRIPTSAGLGGGSADAAAVLRALAPQATTEVQARLKEIAAGLGADVPMCLGGRTARMRGVGDVLEALTQPAPLHLVIATPPFGCDTPTVYRAWDELGGPPGDRVVGAPPGWEAEVPELRNDLEPAALHIEPRLLRFRDEFEAIVGKRAFLCGSGSSYATWCASRTEADASAADVRASTLEVRMVTGATAL